jgi:hypothetical protein
MPNPNKASSPRKTHIPPRLKLVIGVARPARRVARLGKGLWTIEYMGRHYKRKIKRAVGIDGTVVSWVTINQTPVEIAKR